MVLHGTRVPRAISCRKLPKFSKKGRGTESNDYYYNLTRNIKNNMTLQVPQERNSGAKFTNAAHNLTIFFLSILLSESLLLRMRETGRIL